MAGADGVCSEAGPPPPFLLHQFQPPGSRGREQDQVRGRRGSTPASRPGTWMHRGRDCGAQAPRCPGGGAGAGERLAPPSLAIAENHTSRFFTKWLVRGKCKSRRRGRQEAGTLSPGGRLFPPGSAGSSGASSLPQFPRGARPWEAPGPVFQNHGRREGARRPRVAPARVRSATGAVGTAATATKAAGTAVCTEAAGARSSHLLGLVGAPAAASRFRRRWADPSSSLASRRAGPPDARPPGEGEV